MSDDTKNTTEEKTLKEKASLIKELSPDDPLFKLGYVIGGRYSRPPSKRATPPLKGKPRK